MAFISKRITRFYRPKHNIYMRFLVSHTKCRIFVSLHLILIFNCDIFHQFIAATNIYLPEETFLLLRYVQNSSRNTKFRGYSSKFCP